MERFLTTNERIGAYSYMSFRCIAYSLGVLPTDDVQYGTTA